VGIPDYYTTLDVARDASEDELKRAYRKMVISHHPDRHGGTLEATERFQCVVEAYSVLSDSTKRATYDQGHIVRGIRFEKGGNLQEFVGGFFDNVLGVRSRQPSRGYDHLYRLDLTLREIALGVSKELSLPSDATCKTCFGRGFESGVMPNLCERCDGLGHLRKRKVVRSAIEDCTDCVGRGYLISTPCRSCHGKGTCSVKERVTIDIPPGVETGAKLLIRGAGQSGWQGGEKGDCWVHVTTTADPHLQREGQDVICRRPVSLFQAMTGGKIAVPTVEGTVHIKLPPQSLDGASLRIPGYGIYDASKTERGDQIVILDVETPESLTEVDMEILREMRGKIGDDPFPRTQAFDRSLAKGSSRE
jgi:molecular chaperone DnaJ